MKRATHEKSISRGEVAAKFTPHVELDDGSANVMQLSLVVQVKVGTPMSRDLIESSAKEAVESVLTEAYADD